MAHQNKRAGKGGKRSLECLHRVQVQVIRGFVHDDDFGGI